MRDAVVEGTDAVEGGKLDVAPMRASACLRNVGASIERLGEQVRWAWVFGGGDVLDHSRRRRSAAAACGSI